MNQLIKLALLLHLLMDDMHYIHFNCRGRGFRNIHSLAKDYYEKLQNDFDEIVELCMSYGMQVPNPIKAAQLLQYLPLCSDKPFGYKESVALMQQRLRGLVNFLYQLHPEIEDINAKIRIEDLIKEWHKEVNFTLNRMMSEVCELEDDNGHTLLNRMPDFLFDAFRSLIDSKGIIPGYSLLSKFYPHNAKKIIIAFKSKDNFANDKEGGSGSSIDEDLEASLKELDEEVLNEIVEFMSDPSEEAVKKLSDEARKYLESLDEEHLKRLQELVSEGSDDGGSDSEGSGGDNS
jgi:DNA-binding ferritin-like protein